MDDHDGGHGAGRAVALDGVEARAVGGSQLHAGTVLTRLIARAMVRVFFRGVDIDGAARVPQTGPLLVVANHTNGLVDGLLLLSDFPRFPRFLGKATLFRILPLRPLLRLAGVVPVHRAQDGGGAAGNNDAAFRTCRAVLRGGGIVAIFPEGISHDESTLQPLKTGAARIAIGAMEEGAHGLAVVPLALVYDAKARFRSRALVRVGEPFAVEGDDARAVTAMIDDRMSAVLRDGRGIVVPPSEPRWLAAMLVVVGAPFALAGLVIHALPYAVMKRVGQLPRNESIKSTVKLLGCAGLFAVEWLAVGVVAALRWGPLAGLAAVVLCPFTGWVTVRTTERLHGV